MTSDLSQVRLRGDTSELIQDQRGASVAINCGRGLAGPERYSIIRPSAPPGTRQTADAGERSWFVLASPDRAPVPNAGPSEFVSTQYSVTATSIIVTGRDSDGRLTGFETGSVSMSRVNCMSTGLGDGAGAGTAVAAATWRRAPGMAAARGGG
jgi:hypothetical protein